MVFGLVHRMALTAPPATFVIWLLVGCCVLLTGCTPSAKHAREYGSQMAESLYRRMPPLTAEDSVVIMPIRSNPDGRITALGNDLTAQLVQFFSEEAYPRIKVYDRQFTADVAREFSYQWSDYSSPDAAVEFGKNVPATRLVVGTVDLATERTESVPPFRHSYFKSNTRVLDLRTGAVLAADQFEFPCNEFNHGQFETVVEAGRPVELADRVGPPVQGRLSHAGKALGDVLFEQLKQFEGLQIQYDTFSGPSGGQSQYAKLLCDRVVARLAERGRELGLQFQDSRGMAAALQQQREQSSPVFEDSQSRGAMRSAGATLIGRVEIAGTEVTAEARIVDVGSGRNIAVATTPIPYGQGQDELLSKGPQ